MIICGIIGTEQFEKAEEQRKAEERQVIEQYITSYDEFTNIIKNCGFTGNYTLELDEYYDGHEVENSQCIVLQQGTNIAAIYTKDGGVYSIKYQDEDYMYKDGQVLHTLSEYAKTTASSTPTEKFTLLSSTSSSDSSGMGYIEGEIKNNTDKNYSYVQVTFNLYDDSGAQTGTAMDNINNLEANGVWKYKAVAFSANGATKYKLVEITGW